MYDTNILADLFKNKTQQAAQSQEADELIVIVDRSGSMYSIKDDAEGGINNFIEENKQEGVANLTLVEFDNKMNVVYDRVDIRNAEPYKLVPRNSTALYDAVGGTLANAEQITTTGKKIVVITTDGFENASVEYTQQMVFDRITDLKELGWEFLFLAANQDAMGAGMSMGISPGSTVQYQHSGLGSTQAYAAASQYTRSLRGGSSLFEAEAELTQTVASSEALSRTGVVNVSNNAQADSVDSDSDTAE